MTNITMIQTADPFRYRRMLEIGAAANVAYCAGHGIRYEAFIGIKAGTAPHHAMYNRIFQINDLMAAGYRGWVAHLDADAVVYDQSFDLHTYLSDKAGIALVAERANPQAGWWGINNGVFLLNLGTREGMTIASDWMIHFRCDVPASVLANPDSKWDDAPNDQELMYRFLKETKGLSDKVVSNTPALINYSAGLFIRQIMRSTNAPMSGREQAMAALVAQSLRGHDTITTN